jgi:hypothetical protein
LRGYRVKKCTGRIFAYRESFTLDAIKEISISRMKRRMKLIKIKLWIYITLGLIVHKE